MVRSSTVSGCEPRELAPAARCILVPNYARWWIRFSLSPIIARSLRLLRSDDVRFLSDAAVASHGAAGGVSFFCR